MTKTSTMQIKALASSTVQCDGILARVKREVFAAAVAPRSTERDERLAYWHARLRTASAIYYRHALFFIKHPTREQRANARDLDPGGHWQDSAEARQERRQLGCEA